MNLSDSVRPILSPQLSNMPDDPVSSMDDVFSSIPNSSNELNVPSLHKCTYNSFTNGVRNRTLFVRCRTFNERDKGCICLCISKLSIWHIFCYTVFIMRYICFIVLVLLSLGQLNAQDTLRLTLNEVVALARKQSPQAVASAPVSGCTELALVQGRLPAEPHLSSSSQLNRSISPSPYLMGRTVSCNETNCSMAAC